MKVKKMNYKNYIFDLYGTLLDISTNEEKYSLWKYMADLYAAYGAVYTPNELKRRFRTLDRETREKMCKEKNVTFSEIKLEKVFLQLYKEKADAKDFSLENETLCGIDGIYINLNHENEKTIQKRRKALEIQQNFAIIEDIGGVLEY